MWIHILDLHYKPTPTFLYFSLLLIEDKKMLILIIFWRKGVIIPVTIFVYQTAEMATFYRF